MNQSTDVCYSWWVHVSNLGLNVVWFIVSAVISLVSGTSREPSVESWCVIQKRSESTMDLLECAPRNPLHSGILPMSTMSPRCNIPSWSVTMLSEWTLRISCISFCSSNHIVTCKICSTIYTLCFQCHFILCCSLLDRNHPLLLLCVCWVFFLYTCTVIVDIYCCVEQVCVNS